MSQLANLLSERPKDNLSSQSLTNSRNFSQAHVVQDSQMNQCNVVHTLRSGKQVDNQAMPSTPIQHDPTQASTFSSSYSDNSVKDKSTDLVHKSIISFPNRLKNNNKQTAQMEKILEMFNQVKFNVLLLGAVQQVPIYAKFLKDICTKKRKTNIPKKVFLPTDISELLSSLILSSIRTWVALPFLAS